MCNKILNGGSSPTDCLHPASPPAINKMANSLLNFVSNFQAEAARRRLSYDK